MIFVFLSDASFSCMGALHLMRSFGRSAVWRVHRNEILPLAGKMSPSGPSPTGQTKVEPASAAFTVKKNNMVPGKYFVPSKFAFFYVGTKKVFCTPYRIAHLSLLSCGLLLVFSFGPAHGSRSQL